MNAQTFLHHSEYYANWAAEGKSISSAEYCGRIHGVLRWLTAQEDRASAGFRALVSIARQAYTRELLGLPDVKTLGTLPTLPPVPPLPALDMAQKGREAVALLKLISRKLPDRDAKDLCYCLDAARGNRVPESEVDFDHLFAFFFKGLLLAMHPWNEAGIIEILPNFARWLDYAPMNSGYHKDEVARRLLRLLGCEPTDSDPLLMAHKVCRAGVASWNVVEKALRLCGFGTVTQEFRRAVENMETTRIL